MVGAQSKSITVFLSSTFQDMQNERNILIKHTFKKLKDICDHRGIALSELDLRWGITEEEANDGKILPLCFYAIDKARPYFLCMIGGHYGSTLSHKPEDLCNEEPWLNECWDSCSITALEIIYGVIKNPQIQKNALFYFKLTETGSEQDISGITPISSNDRNRLHNLKKLIQKEYSKHPDYISIKTYVTPEDLDALVMSDFLEIINKVAPENEDLDPIDKERRDQDNFLEVKNLTYYPLLQRQYNKYLSNSVLSEGISTVITGNSGSGKTSFLVNWLTETKPNDVVILSYFIGVTSKSTNCGYMLYYLIYEIKRIFQLDGVIPTDFGTLKRDFVVWLGKASRKGKLVLLIDALNQLDDDVGARNLSWLPKKIPSGISLIVSTTSGEIDLRLRNRNWKTLNIEPLSDDEQREVINAYLKHYNKKLPIKNIEKIISNPSSSNPLYLFSLLEELRIFGDHNQVIDLLDKYLNAKDLIHLYTLILERWEIDYGYQKRPSVVRDIFSAIFASRRGLSNAEICKIMQNEEGPLPQLVITRLLYSTERALMTRDAVINFSHDFIRNAVGKRYLDTDELKRAAHSRLADHFSEYVLENEIHPNASELGKSYEIHENKRLLEELPWQYMKAERFEDLKNYLIDPEYFLALWEYNSYDLRNYWTFLETKANPIITAQSAYQHVLDHPDAYNPEFVLNLSRYFELRDKADVCMPLFTHLRDHYKKTNDMVTYATILGKIGWILSRQKDDPVGSRKKALILYKEEEKIARSHPDNEIYENILQITLNYQALILLKEKEYLQAIKLLEEKICISKKIDNHYSHQLGIGNLGLVYFEMGLPEKAMDYYKEQELICEIYGITEGLQITYGRQSLYYRSIGDYQLALELVTKKEKISRDYVIPRSLCTALFTKGEILELMRKNDLAKAAFTECLDLSIWFNHDEAETRSRDGLDRLMIVDSSVSN
ncbi:MAG: DUF4062 domain-containing protein [Candidatus Methanomethylophilaceae archaeon]|nr:DUF4062 domain-containing protein [Candidatus Methanomethylophilaceae archaeon]MDD3069128.1 DUF4062 domain-containing protein [Bacilli bacterium]MDY0224271.1 DUF4062 domain-containing protein [Candidatus Methanomethylophilaceae archaeon]